MDVLAPGTRVQFSPMYVAIMYGLHRKGRETKAATQKRVRALWGIVTRSVVADTGRRYYVDWGGDADPGSYGREALREAPNAGPSRRTYTGLGRETAPTWTRAGGMYVEPKLGIVIENKGSHWHWVTEGGGRGTAATLRQAKRDAVDDA